MHSSSTSTNEYLKRAYTLSSPSDAKELYDKWANSYDKDLSAEEYASPERAVHALTSNLGHHNAADIKVLDAGCGTGLVGEHLAKSSVSGRLTIDGVDISEGMLKVARNKGVYRELDVADLSRPLRAADGSYGALVCVGTLTKGHVGPEAIAEFCRVVASGGLVVLTVHSEIWDSMGYKVEVDKLSANNTVKLLSSTEFGFLKTTSTGGKLIVLQKC